MDQKFWQKIYHGNVNKNFMEENAIQIKTEIMINVDMSVKKHHICEKVYIWNPAICSCKNGKHLAIIIDNSLITCGKVIEEIKTVSTNFNEKNIASKIQNFYILLVFLLLL